MSIQSGFNQVAGTVIRAGIARDVKKSTAISEDIQKIEQKKLSASEDIQKIEQKKLSALERSEWYKNATKGQKEAINAIVNTPEISIPSVEENRLAANALLKKARGEVLSNEEQASINKAYTYRKQTEEAYENFIKFAEEFKVNGGKL